MKKIKVFAPATIANFIVGFDSLGASIDVDNELFGDIVAIESSSHNSVEVIGKYSTDLPKDIENNIVSKSIHQFHKRLSQESVKQKTFALQLEKRLPISSGLGSSASSIIASLVALNTYYDKIFSNQELLFMAGKLESMLCGAIHYDNVAPSLLGSLQLIIQNKWSEPLPWFEDWLIVLYYPGIAVSTKMARELLPKTLDLSSAVQYWQHFSTFIHALYKNDPQLAAAMLRDNLIEPKRAKLIPHFEQIRSAALKSQALAFGISGSGPTCFAIANTKIHAKNICHAIEAVRPFSNGAFCKIANISPFGARILQ